MFEPKPFQKETIKKLADFLEAARFGGARAAFENAPKEVPNEWRKPYVPLDKLAETPYVCLRLPTGGGKTFLAAQAVKVGAKFLERENNPLVLWLMPTDAIRQQTLETLNNPKHPNREQLNTDFDGKLRIVDISDFSLLTPQDLRDKACIVVGTFAALRVEKTEGRKVYDHREDLEPHFASIPPHTPGLECQTDGPDKGRIKFSFANILALVRPLVIVDEAHNATSSLSYEVLQRINAGCVVEFTATPAEDSNVLHHVSASVLKSEEMIKLPIMLTEHPTWQEALTDSILTRQKLAEPARQEPDFLRPIVLIQAESKDREVTVKVVEDYLVEQGKIERERIAVATGSQRELDGINLLDPACKVEFVITVQALKEGWDCSFAYGFSFPKHYYGEGFVGEFDSREEEECARAIEMHPQVKRWVRNVVGMFGLPTATGTFYPDFFAELNDGRVLLVEYKGERLIEHEQQKKNIGERWNIQHRTSNLQHPSLDTLTRLRSGRETTWISVPDQKRGPEEGLWYQGRSRVCPGCPQTTAREAGEASWIPMAYVEHRTLNLEPPVLRSPSSVALLRRVDTTAEGGQYCGGWTNFEP